MFWISTLLLLIPGLALILWPVLRQYPNQGVAEQQRVETNLAFYRGRADEIAAELNNGFLEKSDYDTLMAELHRSLLRDTRSAAPISQNYGTGNTFSDSDGDYHSVSGGGKCRLTWKAFILNPARLIPLGVILIIPMLAYGIYGKQGYYEDIQLSGLFRQAIHPSGDPRETSALIMELKSAVYQYPDNQWAWYFLGRSYSRLGMYRLAGEAYQTALLHLEDEANRVMAMSQIVLAEFLGADRHLTPAARDMSEQILAINPDELTVLRILATEARERGELSTAIEYWRRLVRANPLSASAKVYRSNIVAAENIIRSRGLPALDPSATTLKTPEIRVSVALAPGLELPPDLTVFVAARDALKDGMPPLAVARLRAGDLPATVVLDKASAVGPFNLESSESVTVSALVSRRGVANPQSGDYRVVSSPLNPSVEQARASLVIAEQIR